MKKMLILKVYAPDVRNELRPGVRKGEKTFLNNKSLPKSKLIGKKPHNKPKALDRKEDHLGLKYKRDDFIPPTKCNYSLIISKNKKEGI